MKTIAIILLALILNGCAVYIIKCDCPQKEVIQEWRIEPRPFKPILPYYIPADTNWWYDKINVEGIWKDCK